LINTDWLVYAPLFCIDFAIAFISENANCDGDQSPLFVIINLTPYIPLLYLYFPLLAFTGREQRSCQMPNCTVGLLPYPNGS
jgi:hypothetical protein